MRPRGGALGGTFARGAAVLLVLGAPTCLGLLRHLGDTSDSVSALDFEAGGACEDGCVRTVVNAETPALGEVDCALRVQNLLDHYDGDVEGAALNVVHSCSNEDGELLYEVRDRKSFGRSRCICCCTQQVFFSRRGRQVTSNRMKNMVGSRPFQRRVC